MQQLKNYLKLPQMLKVFISQVKINLRNISRQLDYTMQKQKMSQQHVKRFLINMTIRYLEHAKYYNLSQVWAEKQQMLFLIMLLGNLQQVQIPMFLECLIDQAQRPGKMFYKQKKNQKKIFLITSKCMLIIGLSYQDAILVWPDGLTALIAM